MKFSSVADLRRAVLYHGDEVVVKKQCTKEIVSVNLNFLITRTNPFFNDERILKRENVCYRDVSTGFKRMSKMLEGELTTRKVTFCSRHCISYVHLLVRGKILYCFVNFRSSDCEKLETDLYVVCKYILRIMKKFKLVSCKLSVNIGSAHLVI